MLMIMHFSSPPPSDPSRPTTRGVVVLCDVRGSREIPDRARFVARLDEALRGANRDPGRLLGRFERQAGLDEFAGVLLPGRSAAIVPELWEALHPVAVRYAVVAGALDVVPEPPPDGPPGAAGFDGPAFHRAVEILDGLRAGDRLVVVETGDPREDTLLSALGDLLYARLLEWTERQLEVVRTMRRSNSQEEAAGRLGVHQSTVSRALSAAQHERVAVARAAFEEGLDRAAGREGREKPPGSEARTPATRRRRRLEAGPEGSRAEEGRGSEEGGGPGAPSRPARPGVES
jgi:hypothetical protein